MYDRLANKSGEITGEGNVDFNLGISVVIPAQDILTVLNSEALIEQRKNAAQLLRRDLAAPRAHSASNTPLTARFFSNELPTVDPGWVVECEAFAAIVRE